MALVPGTRIGHLEIVGLLGAGGMGEVYRATDTRLNRDVALKALPDALATDPDRVGRFKREAQVLASLNHPNVAAIYGFEESTASDTGQTSVRALVMELVDGPTLAERLAAGPLPLEEAIAIGRQLAEAIEYAHELGIIHRDLKPANIKLRPDGTVKVLDFGLAKALGDDPRVPSQANSPTLSLAATQAGLILGTAAYMSPEQAKGKPADRRADIWSFGIVLFEMLTGRIAYTGETASETMAAVIMKEPEWAALPATTPPRLRELLRRCLVKDTRSRLQAIGEARIALEDPTLAPDERTGGGTTVGLAAAATVSRRREWIWATLAVASLFAAIALAITGRTEPEALRTVRFEIPTPERGGATPYPQGLVSLSPDGRLVAFVALSGNRPLLWVHSLDTNTAQPLESTAGIGPAILTWSPDSRYIAFSAEGRLRKAAVVGGPSQVIGDVNAGLSSGVGIGYGTGSWGSKDVILVSSGGRLQRVAANGGALVAATNAPNDATEMPRFPHFLPDGRHYFYLAVSGESLVAYVADLESQERRPLAGITSEVKYSSGHVLFLRSGALMAQAFDVNRLELAGDPFVITEDLSFPNATAGAVSVSSNGTLAFRSTLEVGDGQLAWFDRSGKAVGTAGPPGRYADIDLSRDGQFVAFEDGLGGDIHVLDLSTGVSRHVTTHPARDADPAISPDGKIVVFRSDRDGGHLYQRAVGTVGDDVLIFKGSSRESPDDWSPDGRYVTFIAEADIWALPLEGERRPFRVTESPAVEREGQVSPDGRWIAYTSHESGRDEIFVQSFPKPLLKQQVSSGGGVIPRWSHDGTELFYLSGDSTLMAVALRTEGDTLRLSAPSPLFRLRFAGRPEEGEYALSSDGRILANVPVADHPATPITMILNWAAGYRR